jgi:Fe-S cluster assembly protein SufD
MGAFDPRTAAALYDASQAPAWLREVRGRASAAWLASALPTRKTEAWKYTTLEALDGTRWQPAAPDAPVPDARSARIEGLDAEYLVFVDGRYSAALSDPAGGALCSFAAADGAQRALIARHLGGIVDGAQNPFVELGGCWATDGALLHLRRGQRAPRTLCIVHCAGPGRVPVAAAQRTLVVLEEGAEAELVELFAGAGQGLVAGATEILLGRGATLRHRRLHLESGGALHLGGVGADLARDARYHGFVFAAGSRLKRLDLRVRHQEPGSEALLGGVYLARGREHVDLHTTVEHASTHGTTQQVYRGMVDDEAHAVFNGRILIRPGAQKTSADLANRNLLFSDRAEVDTKPELEIYADDVKCSHGTTVSRVEEKGLYYLQSRGIARREAEVLLATGFVEELLAALDREPLHALLRARLRGWFGLAAEEGA